MQELSECAGYIEKHKHLLIEGEYDYGKTDVMYVVEKGYQRKGMNSNFFKNFQNGKPYFDLESVQKAYQFLQADHISSLEELQQNFQKNFIDEIVYFMQAGNGPAINIQLCRIRVSDLYLNKKYNSTAMYKLS